MDQESDAIDPYDLLEVPAELRPPTHYQLLGIDDFETDEELIAEAAKSRNAYLHQIAAGPHRKIVQQLLGEVAVARRTLMNEESRSQYDQYLLEPEEQPVAEAPPVMIATGSDSNYGRPNVPNASEAARERRSRAKRSTWAEWKLHAISASVLLTIVGIVWFVNRGNGERRAAKAGAISKRSPTAASVAAGPRPGSRTASRPISGGNSRQRNPPPAPRRKGPSLAPDFDVKEFLPPSAPEMTKPGANADKTPADDRENTKVAEPNAGDAASSGSPPDYAALTLAANWKSGIPVLDKFDKPLKDRYSFDPKTTGCKLENGRVIVEAATATSKGRQLKLKKPKLAVGKAVALETNVTAKAKRSSQVGVAVGPIRISLASAADGLEVRMRKQGSKETLVAPLMSDGQTHHLIIYRPKGNAKQLRWIAQSGKNNVSGTLTVDGLQGQAPLSIFFSSPQQAEDPATWIDNLRVGDFANQPKWQPTKQQTLQ